MSVRRAPAKVNLGLRVLGRRADGFHELDTLLLAIEPCDRVEARPTEASGVRLEVGGEFGPGVPTGPENLAARAARGVLALAAGDAGVHLTLHKAIPAEAGLGGGSSDAAGAALATAEALGLAPSRAELRELLTGLGSDCAFFLDAEATGVARCTGRGERVEPLAGRPAWSIALLVPDAGASTARVYAALAGRPPEARPAGIAPEELLRLDAAQARSHLANDLEAAALAVEPRLARWRALFDAAGAEHFRLSGSGGAFFGLFDDEGEADAARDDLARRAAELGLGLRASRTVRAVGRGSLPA